MKSRLQSSHFVATDAFTFDDISAFVMVDSARVIKTCILAGNTTTLNWFEQTKSRSSPVL